MNSSRFEPIIDLGTIPFHVGESETPSNIGLPDILPFVVGVRPDIGLIVQAPNPSVHHNLDLAYRKGSIIGTPMSGEGIGRRYADDFLDFVLRAISPQTPKGLRVLEIGCGTGYLLSRLKELGAEVLGVEPGNQGQAGANTYGVEIIRDMFPTKRISADERFDVIVAYGVVEHVLDPASFLELQSRHIAESGVMILSVPDCTECLAAGDVSVFLHEHWSYFTRASLSGLVELAGLHLQSLEASGYGGALYAVAGTTCEAIPSQSAHDESALFQTRVKNAIEHAGRFFNGVARTKSTVGIFCAARAINLLHVLQQREALRFFDDDARLHGKFYPPFEIPIESRGMLLSDPVDELVIMSRSFGSNLKMELQGEDCLRQTRFSLPDEILRPDICGH